MPRIVDHEAQRAQLLDGCFELAARLGYGSVTMRGIARELSVSTGTLYHYFSGKDDLFAQLFVHVSRQHAAGLMAALPADTSSEARVDALLDFVVVRGDDLGRTLLVALDYVRSAPDAGPLLTATLAFYREQISEQIGLAPVVADRALDLLFGLLVRRVLDPSNGAAVDEWRPLVKLLAQSP